MALFGLIPEPEDPSKGIRKQQKANEAKIRTEVARINNMFAGGTYGVNPVSGKYDPMGTYYTMAGTPYSFSLTNPEFMAWAATKGRNVDQKHFAKLQQDYGKFLVGQGRLFSGTETSPGFTEQFYKDRAAATEASLLPQLQSQYNVQNRGLTNRLAGQGLMKSSVAKNLAEALRKEFVTQKQGVANQGIDEANRLRQAVANQQQSLIAQAQTASDPSAVTNLARGAAATLSAPNVFAPLGNMFQNWSNMYLTNQVQNAPQQYYNPYVARGGATAAPLGDPFRRVN